MNARAFAAIFAVLIVLGSLPFTINPTTDSSQAAVPIGDTKQTGLPDTVIQEAASSNLSIPQAEVYYSEFQYVVGYQGVTSLVAGLQTQQERSYGQPLTVHVSDYSGTNVSVGNDGHLRVKSTTPVGWTQAQDAFFVVNSSAQIPMRENAIVPFSDRSEAKAFARQYNGEIRQWGAVQQLSVGQLDRSSTEWKQIVNNRQARTDRLVESSQQLRDRPVSVTVGEDTQTVETAIERAPANTTVLVPSGTYHIDSLNIQKPITIRGAGSNSTHLIGDQNGSVVRSNASQTGIVDLSITGVGSNRTGNDRSVEDIPVNKDEWNYEFWKVHGYGDAAIIFEDADRSFVSSVRINTTSNGVITRNSANTTVSDLTLYGTKQWTDGFLGVVALGEPVIVEDSNFYGGKVGVFSHDVSRTVVRNNTMEGMMLGVFNLFTTHELVVNNTIEDTWNALYIEKRSTGAVVVRNNLHNNRYGAIVAGQANYVAENVMWHNLYGMYVEGQYSLYERNLVAFNQHGVRALSLFPTNRITDNDIVGNTYLVDTNEFQVLNVWPGNYWEGAPGIDGDGDGRLDRQFRPTGPTDGLITRALGAPTIAQSPAVTVTRHLQQLLPGLRSAGVVDPEPRVTPVKPQLVNNLRNETEFSGRHSDPDPWDFNSSAINDISQETNASSAS